MNNPSRLIPAASSVFQWEGRVRILEQGAVRFGFPGAALRFILNGGDLEWRFSDIRGDCFFDVVVNGGQPERIHIHQGVFSHRLHGVRGLVELQRRSESWQGVCTLQGVCLASEGNLLEAPPLPSRRLLFIGDSVTCGEGADRRAGDPLDAVVSNGSHRASAARSYGRLLARRLSSQCHLVSYGGRGVWRDWQGIRATANAPEFYERVCPDEPLPLWSPSSYVPDGTVVALGTNDFSRGIPDHTDFVSAYVEFLRKLRRDFKDTRILIVDSPIVRDDGSPRLTALRAYLDDVASASGVGPCSRLNLARRNGVPGDGHPTGEEHAAMADEIEPELRRLLVWR